MNIIGLQVVFILQFCYLFMSSSQMLGVLLAAATTLGMQAESLGNIAGRLSAASPYRAGVRYEVLLPQSEDPVVYNVDLSAYTPERADTLSPCDYIVQWSMHTPTGESTGFSAYFDGHHYRLRDKRLQEYHYDDNPMPFAAQGSVRYGVQQQAQFASLLPAYLADKMREMASDTSYIYTLRADSTAISVEGVQRIDGYEALEYEYVFDAATGLPVFAEFCYNPGQMSEQSVTVHYMAPGVDDVQPPFSEPKLMSLYPEAFSRYRESGYTLANLPGRPLPEISSPTLSGERYHREMGEPFGMPAVVAILDPEVDGCDVTAEELRSAIEASPSAALLIMAFNGKHPERVAEIVGRARPDEVVLTRASGLARDCGATTAPVVIVCDADGNVTNVHTGRNKDMRQIVMQEIAINKKY